MKINISDARVESWLLLGGPLPIVVVFISYLLFVWLGPKFMKNRGPLYLKPLIIPYNFGLTVLSVYMFYEVCV